MKFAPNQIGIILSQSAEVFFDVLSMSRPESSWLVLEMRPKDRANYGAIIWAVKKKLTWLFRVYGGL